MKKEDNLFEVVYNDGHDHDHAHSDVVELFDENGNPVQFNIIANLELDEEEYAILSNVEDEEEVLIFKVTEEAEGFVFESVEDEATLDAVIEAYNELLDEFEDEEEIE
jgi:rRNA maturation protein Rpf1